MIFVFCFVCLFVHWSQNTKQYELLNYSEHGTTVDNVLYSCDFSEKTHPSPASSTVAQVQSIIRECQQQQQIRRTTTHCIFVVLIKSPKATVNFTNHSQ